MTFFLNELFQIFIFKNYAEGINVLRDFVRLLILHLIASQIVWFLDYQCLYPCTLGICKKCRLSSHSRLSEWETLKSGPSSLCFKVPSRWFLSMLEFENHCSNIISEVRYFLILHSHLSHQKRKKHFYSHLYQDYTYLCFLISMKVIPVNSSWMPIIAPK